MILKCCLNAAWPHVELWEIFSLLIICQLNFNKNSSISGNVMLVFYRRKNRGRDQVHTLIMTVEGKCSTGIQNGEYGLSNSLMAMLLQREV